MTPICAYCGRASVLVTGKYLHPFLPEVSNKRFWMCEPCDAYVGCHPPAPNKRGGYGEGGVPLGTLANAPLRAARALFHREFDVLWRGGAPYQLFSRSQAYSWLASALGIPINSCHIGMFNEELCQQGVTLVKQYKELIDWNAYGRLTSLTWIGAQDEQRREDTRTHSKATGRRQRRSG